MKVNLLIIGAGRSGTTSLYEYLKDHPDICFSNFKEIPYFTVPDIFTRGESYYHSFFKPKYQKIVASSDTYLLIDPEAPKKIYHYNPEIRFIIMLREPISRAYSSYIYAIKNGHEKKSTSFIESFNNEKKNIEKEDIAVKNNLGHFYTGLYHKHIKNWMEYFPRENFLLIKTDELKNDYKNVLNKISNFLNINNFLDKREVRTNEAAGVKNMFLHRLIINRNSSLRKFLRKILPDSIKSVIFNSGIIEKIKFLNKKQTSYKTMNQKEQDIVKNYFKKDLGQLKDEFGISFNS